MVEIITQTLLAILTLLATWLSQDPRKSAQKWAPICGLLVQPIWIYVGYTTAQWGVLFVSFAYMVVWARGIKTYWMDKK